MFVKFLLVLEKESGSRNCRCSIRVYVFVKLCIYGLFYQWVSLFCPYSVEDLILIVFETDVKMPSDSLSLCNIILVETFIDNSINKSSKSHLCVFNRLRLSWHLLWFDQRHFSEVAHSVVLRPLLLAFWQLYLLINYHWKFDHVRTVDLFLD